MRLDISMYSKDTMALSHYHSIHDYTPPTHEYMYMYVHFIYNVYVNRFDHNKGDYMYIPYSIRTVMWVIYYVSY